MQFFIITLIFEKNAKFFDENWQESQKIVIITSTPGYPALGYQAIGLKPSALICFGGSASHLVPKFLHAFNAVVAHWKSAKPLGASFMNLYFGRSHKFVPLIYGQNFIHKCTYVFENYRHIDRFLRFNNNKSVLCITHTYI
jgi:hypothetical protein